VSLGFQHKDDVASRDSRLQTSLARVTDESERDSNLLVARGGENDAMAVRHAAFDVDLLAVLLLDRLLALALLAPAHAFSPTDGETWRNTDRSFSLKTSPAPWHSVHSARDVPNMPPAICARVFNELPKKTAVTRKYVLVAGRR
jgi:hypothetical protein